MIQRLDRVAKLADRVSVFGGDAIDLLACLAERDADELFVYADPPYLTKSSDLYVDAMTYEKHKELAYTLESSFRRWIVSYDCDTRVADVYESQTRHLQPAGLVSRQVRRRQPAPRTHLH